MSVAPRTLVPFPTTTTTAAVAFSGQLDGTPRRVPIHVRAAFVQTSACHSMSAPSAPTPFPGLSAPFRVVRALDDADAEVFDEASCRALLESAGANETASYEMWAAVCTASTGVDTVTGVDTGVEKVTKRQLLTSLCHFPGESFADGFREAARGVNDEAEAAAAGTPHFYDLDPEQVRAKRRETYEHSARRRDVCLGDLNFASWVPSGAGAGAPAAAPRAVYLLFHGGGWVFGDAAGQNDTRLEQMCEELGVVILVPDYRKAPEHPYPEPLDDCEAAASWAEAHAIQHFGLSAAAPLLIGGESAGGNLCAAVLLRRKAMHDRAGTQLPWRLANLVYGIFDVAGSPSVAAFGDRRLVETARDVQYFGDCYCPDPALRLKPDVSPLHGDLTGMPPAVFTVGTEDALVDDTLLMYERWVGAGSVAWLDVWPEAPHGVGHFGIHGMTPLGLACRARIHAHIARFLDGCS